MHDHEEDSTVSLEKLAYWRCSLNSSGTDRYALNETKEILTLSTTYDIQCLPKLNDNVQKLMFLNES